MSIPVATTRITVTRPPSEALAEDPLGDGYDEDSSPAPWQSEVVTSGVRATIAAGSARGTENGGQSESHTFRLMADPCDLRYYDEVTDETTGAVYRVEWATPVAGLAGLGHTIAGLTTTKGQGT